MNAIWTRSRPWLPTVAVLAVVLCGTFLLLPRGFGDRHADTGNVSAERSVVCFGHVDIEHGVLSLSPSATGRVIEILVSENQVVKAGAVLMRLDDTRARLLVEEARADLKAADVRLTVAGALPEQHSARLAMQSDAIEAARSRLAASRHLLARKKSLRESKLLSDDEVQAADEQVKEMTAAWNVEQQKLRELKLDDPAAQMELAAQNVRVRQARLDQATHNLEEYNLCAPVAGQVLRVLAAPGDVAGGAGKPLVIQLCPAQPRIVRAEVPQGFANLLAVGQPVLIQDDIRTDDTWRGKVARISDWYTQRRSILQEPLQHNDVRTVECVVEVEPGQAPLRIGQRMLVSLNCASSRER